MEILEVEVTGLTFKNPIIVGSAGYAEDENGIKRLIKRGYAGIVTKSTSKEPMAGAPPPRVFWYDPYKKTWLDGQEAHRNPGIEKMAASLKACKDLAEKENCHLIGSASFNTIEEAVYNCTKFEEAGVDAIELDLICTNVGPHLGADYATRGRYWGDAAHPERTMELLKAIKAAVDIPVWAKIPIGAVMDNREIEKEVDAFAFVGGRLPGLAIDLETGRPIFAGNILLKIKKNMNFMPYTAGIFPVTVLATAFLRSKTKLPLLPSGGIERGFDVIQVMMAGAPAVEVCTAIYRDINVIDSMLREITWYLDKKGHDSLSEIVGIAIDHIPFELMELSFFAIF